VTEWEARSISDISEAVEPGLYLIAESNEVVYRVPAGTILHWNGQRLEPITIPHQRKEAS
jgi:hypothetical protein